MGQGKERVNIGFNLPSGCLLHLRTLNQISSLLLPLEEISFSSFVSSLLNGAKMGIIDSAQVGVYKDVDFISLRLSTMLKKEIEDVLSKEEINYGENQIVEFSKFVKYKMLSSMSSEGTYHSLGYVWLVSLLSSLLEDELGTEIVSEMIVGGEFPDMPGFYGYINDYLSEVKHIWKGELGVNQGKERLKEIEEKIAAILDELHSEINKIKETQRSSRPSMTKSSYDSDAIGFTMSRFVEVLQVLPILTGDLTLFPSGNTYRSSFLGPVEGIRLFVYDMLNGKPGNLTSWKKQVATILRLIEDVVSAVKDHATKPIKSYVDAQEVRGKKHLAWK